MYSQSYNTICQSHQLHRQSYPMHRQSFRMHRSSYDRIAVVIRCKLSPTTYRASSITCSVSPVVRTNGPMCAASLIRCRSSPITYLQSYHAHRRIIVCIAYLCHMYCQCHHMCRYFCHAYRQFYNMHHKSYRATSVLSPAALVQLFASLFLSDAPGPSYAQPLAPHVL